MSPGMESGETAWRPSPEFTPVPRVPARDTPAVGVPAVDESAYAGARDLGHVALNSAEPPVPAEAGRGGGARDFGRVALDSSDLGRPEAVAPEQHGFRDRTAAEFRSQHPGEFLEPMARPYPVEKFAEPERLVQRVNPDFGEKSGCYDVNCADCARSFEQGWRGHLEEAAGRVPDRALVVEGEEASLPERPSLTEEWAGERFRPVDDTDAFRDRMLDAGHGASAIVHTQFVGPDGMGGGHAYNVVNDHGRLKVCDPQEGMVSVWTDGTIHPDLPPTTSHLAMGWNAAGSRIW